MQLSDTRKVDFDQNKQSKQNKLEVVKKKASLLKKKKLPTTKLFSNIDLKHVININDVCFINEESLRFPDTSEETLLKALYSYKMISKVTLNNSFINIQLKKNNDNLLPPQYFIERLKSFGDQQMSRIANHLQKINYQFSKIKESCPVQQQSFLKDKQHSLLQSFIEKMDGKKYLIYFNQITPEKMTLKSVIFSVPLLQALGCIRSLNSGYIFGILLPNSQHLQSVKIFNHPFMTYKKTPIFNLKNIAMDFLRYKHVFFEVFTAKKYKFFIDKCMQNFSKIQAQLMIRPNISEEQKQQITSFIYDDEVIRTKQGPEGIYEQISHAKVRWFSPHPSICCFEILQLDEAEGIKIPKLRKINHFEETKPNQQIKELQKIGINFPLLKIKDVKKDINKLNVNQYSFETNVS